MSVSSDIKIIPYSEDLKEHIRILNEEWLNKYFRVEESDYIQLGNPKEEIIDKGGFIFFAQHKQGIVGTASLLKISDQEFELGKMAVTESAQGLGVGNALMDHCIAFVLKRNVRKLILYSNRKLKPAIHIYHKYGFIEVPMESGHYERADIKMEKVFDRI